MSKQLAWVRSCKGGKEPKCEHCLLGSGHLEVYQLLDYSRSFDRHDYRTNLSFQVLVCKLCHDTYEAPEGYYAIKYNVRTM